MAKLLEERDGKEAELNVLLGKSAKDLWNADLDVFLEEWQVRNPVRQGSRIADPEATGCA